MEVCVFQGETVELARRIRAGYRGSFYNHRHLLPPNVDEKYQLERFRVGYAAFKHEVALVLSPKTIIEIGIGIGVSATAFLHACPTALYTGIDNDAEAERDFPVRPSQFVRDLLARQGYNFEVIVADSQKLDALPTTADLIHVDGDHRRECARHDFTLAWHALNLGGHILVDDARDSSVSAGVFDALADLQPGSVEWAYFDDTYTGNLLVSKERPRP